MVKERTWRNVGITTGEEIKNYLLKNNGWEKEVKNPNELWRIKLPFAVFTYYKNGTLHSSLKDFPDEKSRSLWSEIDSIAGPRYRQPTKKILVGLDEAGKGEVIGPMVLTGVLFPAELFLAVDEILGAADTKVRQNFFYWDKIYRELLGQREKRFSFVREEIPPQLIDQTNLNRLLDKGYKKILSLILKSQSQERKDFRIVLDDYGVGERLKGFMNSLKREGAEIIIQQNADEDYLEVKAASAIAKRFREAVVKKIREDPRYQIAGLTVGSGNPGDRETKEWLRNWYKTYKDFPWFVKKSFKTIRGLI